MRRSRSSVFGLSCVLFIVSQLLVTGKSAGHEGNVKSDCLLCYTSNVALHAELLSLVRTHFKGHFISLTV